jgi:hypothetical protein
MVTSMQTADVPALHLISIIRGIGFAFFRSVRGMDPTQRNLHAIMALARMGSGGLLKEGSLECWIHGKVTSCPRCPCGVGGGIGRAMTAGRCFW